jgi:hypothetical protein
VTNVTYSNIQLSNIKQYGIDIEQDYLNGGPTGLATNGVVMTNIVFRNIKGWESPRPQTIMFCVVMGVVTGLHMRMLKLLAGEKTVVVIIHGVVVPARRRGVVKAGLGRNEDDAMALTSVVLAYAKIIFQLCRGKGYIILAKRYLVLQLYVY